MAIDPSTRAGEARLVLRAQLGDRGALEALMVATTPWLRVFLSRLLADHAVAEDVAQDALVEVARKLPWLREARAYRTWVYRIAVRLAGRAGRREARQAADRDVEHEVAADPPRSLDPEDRAALECGIAALSPNTREVIVLHYAEGLSIGQVAAVLGIPDGTAKSRLASGLGELRRLVRRGEP